MSYLLSFIWFFLAEQKQKDVDAFYKSDNIEKIYCGTCARQKILMNNFKISLVSDPSDFLSAFDT